MKALITGGAGFIGSHLAHALCESGFHVTIIDDLSFGSEANLRWRSLHHSVEFVLGTICDLQQLRPLVENSDLVFHLAALPSIGVSTRQLSASQDINLDATRDLLLLCRDAHVKRFIFASTAAIYGPHGPAPFKESDRPAPEIAYAVQKFAAESYARLISKFDEFATVSLRLSNVFGPGQSFSSPYSGVVAQYCTAFVNDEKPIVIGGGTHSADFIYISDAVQALQSAATVPVGQIRGRVINVGSGRSVSLMDLLSILKELTGKELGADFLPGAAEHLWSPPLDITSAGSLLGFKPAVGLFHGVWETFRFYQQLSDSIPAI